MCNFSKCTAPSKAKRNSCIWVTVDTGDLTAEEHEAARTDATFHSIKSGKHYGQCKYHHRFPDCTFRTRR